MEDTDRPWHAWGYVRRNNDQLDSDHKPVAGTHDRPCSMQRLEVKAESTAGSSQFTATQKWLYKCQGTPAEGITDLQATFQELEADQPQRCRNVFASDVELEVYKAGVGIEGHRIVGEQVDDKRGGKVTAMKHVSKGAALKPLDSAAVELVWKAYTSALLAVIE